MERAARSCLRPTRRNQAPFRQEGLLGCRRTHRRQPECRFPPMARVQVTLRVNGEPVPLAVGPAPLLVHALRDELGLTGTKIGCDTSQCGACTVLVDGRAFKSCTLLTVRLDGAEVTTIEGLADGMRLH